MNRIVVYFFLFLLSQPTFPSHAQQNKIDSLEKQLANMPADTNRVILLNKLTYQYFTWGTDTSKTKSYAQQCLQLAHQLRYNYGIGQAYTALGNYYYSRNQNPEALKQYEMALPFYQRAGRKRGLAVIYSNIASVTEYMGNYTKAMEYYLKSTRIAEELDDKGAIGRNLSAIGLLRLSQKKYEDALRYLFQALSVHKSNQDNIMKAHTLNTIGEVYLQRKQYDKALQYLNQSLLLGDSLGLAQGKIDCYNSLGHVYSCLKQYDQAFNFYQNALVLAEPQGHYQSMSIALEGMAEVYQEKGDLTKAVVYFKRSLELAETNKLAQQKLEAHQGLTAAYAQLKDYYQAYFHQSKLLSLKDSLYNHENDQKIAQLEASYEIDKKQVEIELLHKDQQRALLFRNAILMGLLGTLVIIGLIVNRQRLKNRKNRLLLEKSEEITTKNTQLELQAEVMSKQADELAISNAQLAQQASQLQKFDRVKSNFFTNISHEFRTPLTLIITPLEKLMSDTLNNSQIQKHYQLIDWNARHLLYLINQLLDFSKLEAGSLKVQLIRSDVNQSLKVATYAFASLAESKNIQLHFQSGYQTIHALFAPDILDKILNNLLSNAFKFTPPGGQVKVGINLQHTPDSTTKLGDQITNWNLEITVTDTGIGIPAGQIGHIFNRFFQVDGSQIREQQGTGIGLSLVKELLALQQGSILVKSEVGSGTEFTVYLPLVECNFEINHSTEQSKAESGYILLNQEENTQQELESLPVQTEPNEHYPVMLLIEDNDEVRKFILESFQDEFQVVEASNGTEGLKIARKVIPDIILTDRMMANMDGMEVCRQLKTDERTSHIPVIMLTAKASEESKIEGLETGADDYILKPFRMQELKVRVKNLIEQRKKLRERFTREVKIQPRDIAITSADEAFLNKAIRLIEEHMSDTDFTVETFVQKIALSRVQLHRKLKALTNQSTSEFIRSIRLKRAAVLLEQQYGNIAEVMYEVGFNNKSYFANNFRKMFGVNPSDYHSYITQAGRIDTTEKAE
ncbi:tetratricopeptide repeat protein [Rhodocytophaga rosea]|uniref:histidine kinase n=1 Tax=Rhodocytophaga rosea TaxID=2704465 RepID=A0A6C0GBQ7_9BACT|nr:tetratricopeptide repeat protein [Rhodocytophaga rosea]QHT65242.1 tetratricopeptide repeat protein [Rhodocytophaga rosea]